MATMRLVPSTIYNAASSYLTVSDADNAYTNTDSTTYATVQNTYASTSNRYIYLRGFNFDDIPSNAVINSFEIKYKASESGGSTSSSYRPRICNNTTTLTGSSTAIGTTATAYSFTSVTDSWETISGYGADFGIRINCRRNARNTAATFYIYGAEIEVNYTAEDVHVTGISLDKSTDSIEVGETTTLTETITPSNATDKVVTWSTSNSSVATVSNGVVTGVSQGTARITVTTHDGGYTDYCDVTVTPTVTYTYVQASTMQPGKNYLIANGNTGSVYLMTNESGGSRQLEGVSVTVTNGKITINGSIKAKAEFACSLYDSGNAITTCIVSNGKYLYSDNSSGLRFETTSSLNRFWHYNGTKFWQFKSTTSDGYTDTSTEYKYYLTVSNGNFTDNHVTSPSIENSTLPEIYLFTEDTGDTDTMYVKLNGAWVPCTAVYKKVNGSWVEQSDISNVFQSGVNYKYGGG